MLLIPIHNNHIANPNPYPGAVQTKKLTLRTSELSPLIQLLTQPGHPSVDK